jgi:hypothetical protein
MQGFGFVAGEHVSVQVGGTGSEPSSGPIQTVADRLGRLRLSLHAYVPCDFQTPPPHLIAVGDRGTSVVTELFDYSVCPICNPQLGLACPVVPVAAPGATVARSGTVLLSVGLHPFAVRRGASVRARIQTQGADRIRLTVEYPGHRTSHRIAKIQGGGLAVLHWRVPRSVPSGPARVQVESLANGTTVQSSFLVK